MSDALLYHPKEGTVARGAWFSEVCSGRRTQKTAVRKWVKCQNEEHPVSDCSNGVERPNKATVGRAFEERDGVETRAHGLCAGDSHRTNTASEC